MRYFYSDWGHREVVLSFHFLESNGFFVCFCDSDFFDVIKFFFQGDSYCKYKLYMEEKDTVTAKINSTINPEYKHSKMFSFSPVTKVVSSVMTISLARFSNKFC